MNPTQDFTLIGRNEEPADEEGAENDVDEDEVFSFVASSIPSVWALESLLLLKRVAPKGRRADELIVELRSSTTAVSEALLRLHGIGLIVEEAGTHYYRPASPTLAQLVMEIERLYALKPAAMIKTIIMGNNKALQIFANSFKLKE